MNLILFLKRPFIWLSRFRHRCGYGVHSPFAFGLTDDVIYEKRPYYAYASLAVESRKRINDQGWDKGLNKVNRLLFRLVNRVQPQSIVEMGRLSMSSLYLQTAKPSASFLFVSSLSELFLDADIPIDFLYLNDYKQPRLMEETFQVCIKLVTTKSVFVINGIHYSIAMKTFWKQLKEDNRVGITFDLYDVGIVFFDTSKIKQHYLVNF